VKAILVLEMPENCFKCKLQDWANCRIVKGCHIGDTRPDWCPLKEVPEKKNRNNRVVGDYLRGRSDGYNACIDEILGDKE
jgi:hypothetical protein